MTIAERIEQKHTAIARVCQERGVKRLSLFGSALGPGFTRRSDIDLLVEFLPGRTPGLIALAAMEIDLTRVLRRKVDLRTPAELSHFFREEVMTHARPLYAKE